LPRRRTILACACVAGAAASSPGATEALAQESVGADEVGVGDPTTVAAEPGARPAGDRLQTAYERWRHRLRRYDVSHGRNLVAAARNHQRPPTARELSHSIHRMQRRFHRFLGTPRGRAAVFRLKVRHIPAWGRNHLRGIASCESRGNPRAVGGGGVYRGMYQFSFTTWRVVGGSGDPAVAPRSEQTWRAWLLLSRHGSGHWPVCG
jgi:Transglycosylase-like domain